MDIEKDLAKIADQEAKLRFSAFDEGTAWTLGSLLRSNAQAQGVAVVIEVRLARETVFLFAMPGTTAANVDWVRRKRNTVELLKRSSYATGLALKAEGNSLEGKMGLLTRDYASHGGSFPIIVEGVGCIGAVTVSGLPQREDHVLVVQALSELCGVSIPEMALD